MNTDCRPQQGVLPAAFDYLRQFPGRSTIAAVMKVFSQTDKIVARKDEPFGIALEVQGAGGYEWHVQTSDEIVSYIASDFERPTSQVGGAGKQVLKFRPRRNGAAVLHLLCKRPWDQQPAQTLTVHVTVKSGKSASSRR